MKLTFGNNSIIITGPALGVSASQRWGEEEEEKDWYRLLTTSPTTPGLMRSEEQEEDQEILIVQFHRIYSLVPLLNLI